MRKIRYACMYVCVYGWIDGWCVGGLVDRWMEVCVNFVNIRHDFFIIYKMKYSSQLYRNSIHLRMFHTDVP